jgi:hypothetical protein
MLVLLLLYHFHYQIFGIHNGTTTGVDGVSSGLPNVLVAFLHAVENAVEKDTRLAYFFSS